RFWITLDQAFTLVMFALENMEGGEIFVPKIPSMKLVDLFDIIVPGIEKEIIGIRPGEKLHEVLLTEQEARHSLSLEKYYVILPEFMENGKYKKYNETGKYLEKDFRFASHANEDWLEGERLMVIIEELRKIL
ncbi:MAG: polysaccharide biosynthesis protein, partial [Patescibacteria group bacterium]